MESERGIAIIFGCSRCGKDHQVVTEGTAWQRSRQDGGVAWSATCPVTGEEICGYCGKESPIPASEALDSVST